MLVQDVVILGTGAFALEAMEAAHRARAQSITLLTRPRNRCSASQLIVTHQIWTHYCNKCRDMYMMLKMRLFCVVQQVDTALQPAVQVCVSGDQPIPAARIDLLAHQQLDGCALQQVRHCLHGTCT